jgi:hypothetical protein
MPFIGGSGYSGYIPIFIDGENVESSVLRKDNNYGIIQDNGVSTPNALQYFTVNGGSQNSASYLRVKAINDASNSTGLDIASFGGTYFPGGVGPDGLPIDGATQIQSDSKEYLDIHCVHPTGKGHLSHRWESRLSWTDVGVGLKNKTPAGVFHPIQSTGNYAQTGINCNVGPYVSYMNRNATSGMVEFRDSFVTSQYGDPILQFPFLAPYGDVSAGFVGWLDISLYDGGNGASYYGHFSIRFINEGAQTITKDYGDSSMLNLTDSGNGVRLIFSDSGAPNYTPVFNIKVVSAGATYGYYEIDYHLFLRRILFPITPA